MSSLNVARVALAAAMLPVVMTACDPGLAPAGRGADGDARAGTSPTHPVGVIDDGESRPGSLRSSGGGRPPPNEVEAHVLAAFEALGVQGALDEQGFRDANASGALDGVGFTVHVYYTDDREIYARGDPVETFEREGLTVHRYSSDAWPLSLAVECPTFTYEVFPGGDPRRFGGSPPPEDHRGVPVLLEFLELLLDVVGCAARPS